MDASTCKGQRFSKFTVIFYSSITMLVESLKGITLFLKEAAFIWVGAGGGVQLCGRNLELFAVFIDNAESTR